MADRRSEDGFPIDDIRPGYLGNDKGPMDVDTDLIGGDLDDEDSKDGNLVC